MVELTGSVALPGDFDKTGVPVRISDMHGDSRANCFSVGK